MNERGMLILASKRGLAAFHQKQSLPDFRCIALLNIGLKEEKCPTVALTPILLSDRPGWVNAPRTGENAPEHHPTVSTCYGVEKRKPKLISQTLCNKEFSRTERKEVPFEVGAKVRPIRRIDFVENYGINICRDICWIVQIYGRLQQSDIKCRP